MIEGKVAVVTGGLRGMGAIIAEKLAQEGANRVVFHSGDRGNGGHRTRRDDDVFCGVLNTVDTDFAGSVEVSAPFNDGDTGAFLGGGNSRHEALDDCVLPVLQAAPVEGEAFHIDAEGRGLLGVEVVLRTGEQGFGQNKIGRAHV